VLALPAVHATGTLPTAEHVQVSLPPVPGTVHGGASPAPPLPASVALPPPPPHAIDAVASATKSHSRSDSAVPDDFARCATKGHRS
jgi:hypothetical protein